MFMPQNISNEKTAERNIKKKKRVVKARTAITISGVALSLVVVFIILMGNYFRTYESARSDVIELSKNSSIQNANNIDVFFTRHTDMLFAAAELLEYTLSKEETGIPDVLKLLQNLTYSYSQSTYYSLFGKDFDGIYAAIDGKMVHSSKTDEDLPEGYDLTKRPWYLEGKAGGGEVIFGEPYYDAYDPKLMVISVSKLLSDGETVIAMDIPLEDLQSAGREMDVTVTLNGRKHDYGHGIILTAKGIVMGHWLDTELGKNYGDPDDSQYILFNKVVECTDNNEDYMEADINGELYGIFPHRLSNGWYVVTLTSLEDIKTTISDFSKLLLMGTAFITALALAYCILISRAYIRSERLTINLQGALDMATTDKLTGYRNRTAYDIKVRELSENIGKHNDTSFVCIMMDLNDLKYINDQVGHAAGDKYICNSCALVQSIIPSEIYRIGGDEFALFLTGDLFNNWENIYNALKQTVSDANLALTPSVDTPSIAMGIAIHMAGDNDEMDMLFRKADAEMYTNKAAIKQARLDHSENGYTPDLKLKVLDKQILASEMYKGLEEEQFEVWFQPQVNHANNGALIGAEALVRWMHPERGLISPIVFIPLFEYNGLIYELDKYVWKHTCQIMRRWVNDGMPPFPISVNISRLDLIQPDFIDTFISITEEYQIPYEYLHLEVTESAFSDNTGKIVETVNELISRGFVIAIDDFGSGYSSLNLLQNVPAHIVKLDMRFFAKGNNQSRNDCIVESVIRMCKMLGMGVLSEGVEHKEQADLLRTQGCDYIQGYLYSKPMTYNEFIEYMKTTVSEKIQLSTGSTVVDSDADSPHSQMLFHNIIAGINDAIIVADSKTKQVLYANRAAEEYFGKRFDPMHPTTCIQYCEKGKLCENCPANDMKPGEKREYVYSENGCHIKLHYAQMDWNGYDAFAFYQTDISAEMREMEFANTLMNNLGVGIIIFRGVTPDELIPVFCNKAYMLLSGLSFEEFHTTIRKNCLYGVHPDDIYAARQHFITAFHSGQPMRCHFRVIKPSGAYEWVSMHANIKKLDEGGFEVYMLFRDAEPEMKAHLIDIKRYKSSIEWRLDHARDSVSTLHLNVTKDTCQNVYRGVAFDRPIEYENGIGGFLASALINIADDEIMKEFAEAFSRKALLERFERGIFANTIRLPIRLSDQRVIWCNQEVSISKNPETNDVEAIMTLIEADRDIRLSSFYKNIIRNDYELVASIETKTGFVTIIDEPKSHGLPNIYGKVVHYMENLSARISVLVDNAYVDACLNALDFETILKKLEEPGDYICTFPAKPSLAGENAAFRWHFGYIDGIKSEILFTRIKVSSFGCDYRLP